MELFPLAPSKRIISEGSRRQQAAKARAIIVEIMRATENALFAFSVSPLPRCSTYMLLEPPASTDPVMVKIRKAGLRRLLAATASTLRKFPVTIPSTTGPRMNTMDVTKCAARFFLKMPLTTLYLYSL